LAQLLYILILISATLLYHLYKAAPGGAFTVYAKIRADSALAVYPHTVSTAAGFLLRFFWMLQLCHHNSAASRFDLSLFITMENLLCD